MALGLCESLLIVAVRRDWGEPESAQHRREVRALCVFVYLSVCPSVVVRRCLTHGEIERVSI